MDPYGPVLHRHRRRHFAGVGVIAILLAVVMAVAAAVPASATRNNGRASLPPITEPPEDPPDDPPDDPPPDDPPPPASFDYSMPDRYGGDSNGDGLVDYYTPSDFCAEDNAATCSHLPPTNPNPISPQTWHVDLDACWSALAQGTNATYNWQVVGGGGAISGGPGCNQWDLTVPAEGKYTLQLTITSSLGTATVTKDVTVQDFLIVALGDSYGSGEGSPDHDMVRGFLGIKETDAHWQDRRCHRSAKAGSAQAAKWIEQADPHTSVTFIHTACSGAEILTGFLNPYDGVDSTWEAKYNDPLEPQLTQARNLIGNREVDALYMSVGGNDANFAKIVIACLAQNPCNPQNQNLPDIVYPDLFVPAICTSAAIWIPPPAGVIVAAVCAVAIASFLVAFSGDTAEHWFDQGIRGTGNDHVNFTDYRLTGLYTQLKDRLHATSPGPNGEPFMAFPEQYDNRIFLSQYVDATHDDDGSYCPKGDLFKPQNDIRVPGLADFEYAWIDTQVEQKLNAVIAHNAEANGWNLVDGVYDRFLNHGICADDTFFTGLLVDTFWREDDMHGAVHPNPSGQAVYRDRIISEMLPTLYPGTGGENLDIRNLTGVQNWVFNHSPRLPAMAPHADAGGPYVVAEGSTVPAVNGSYDDGAMTHTWSTNNGNVATVAPANAVNPTITGVDNGSATLTLGVSDDADTAFEDTDTATVNVYNVMPTSTPITNVPASTAINTTITAKSSYTDPGADDHTITWSWGDGTSTVQNKAVNFDGAISATHKYTAAGQYMISMAVDDKDGGNDLEFASISVVDSRGTATGSGAFQSPQGSLAADWTKSGKTTFSISAKFKAGTLIPIGTTKLTFTPGGFQMTSTKYDSFTFITPTRVRIEGEAKVNGQTGYRFFVAAIDTGTTGGKDLLRVKVWRASDNVVVYDNENAEEDPGPPVTPITTGRITVKTS